MKAYRDHLKRKFTPTLFGLFETQVNYTLETLYRYIHDEEIWSSGAITAHGPTSGHYRKVMLHEVKNNFDVCTAADKQLLLAKTDEYIKNYESSHFHKPAPEVLVRLHELRDYFANKIENQPSQLSFS